MNQQHVFDAIAEEARFQAQWQWTDKPHTVGEWILAIDQHLEFAKRAWLLPNSVFGEGEPIKQLRITACLIMRCMEDHGLGVASAGLMGEETQPASACNTAARHTYDILPGDTSEAFEDWWGKLSLAIGLDEKDAKLAKRVAWHSWAEGRYTRRGMKS